MIEHTVTFTLVHDSGSSAEADFLEAAAELQTIPGVQNFRIRRQVSKKHPHALYISMNFSSQTEYDFYVEHPLHVSFVQDRWLSEVTDFQEADFVDL